MIKTLKQFCSSFPSEKASTFVSHFDKIYECSSLEEHELKIIYLAYLWKNGRVQLMDDFGQTIVDPEELGVNEYTDYEISFECGEGEGGGVNLSVLYEFYDFEKLMELV